MLATSGLISTRVQSNCKCKEEIQTNTSHAKPGWTDTQPPPSMSVRIICYQNNKVLLITPPRLGIVYHSPRAINFLKTFITKIFIYWIIFNDQQYILVHYIIYNQSNESWLFKWNFSCFLFFFISMLVCFVDIVIMVSVRLYQIIYYVEQSQYHIILS